MEKDIEDAGNRIEEARGAVKELYEELDKQNAKLKSVEVCHTLTTRS